MFPGIDDVTGKRRAGRAAVQRNDPDLADDVALRQRQRHLPLHRKPPGTYLYESGTDADKQVQMGLYGALVVRPAGHPDWAYRSARSPIGQFLPSTEYVMLLSEIDPALHQAVECGQAYDATALHPRYWLINGRAFPDTIAPNGAAWLPAQPYSSLVHVTVTDPLVNPDQPPALIRYLDAGSLNHPFHPHGQNGTVVARDADAAAHVRTGHLVRDVRVHDRLRPDLGPDLPLRGPGAVQREQPDPGHDPAAPEPDVQGRRDLLQRQPVPRVQGPAAGRRHLLQRVRRVLPGRPQPCAERGRQLRRGLRRDADPGAHRSAAGDQHAHAGSCTP